MDTCDNDVIHAMLVLAYIQELGVCEQATSD